MLSWNCQTNENDHDSSVWNFKHVTLPKELPFSLVWSEASPLDDGPAIIATWMNTHPEIRFTTWAEISRTHLHQLPWMTCHNFKHFTCLSHMWNVWSYQPTKTHERALPTAKLFLTQRMWSVANYLLQGAVRLMTIVGRALCRNDIDAPPIVFFDTWSLREHTNNGSSVNSETRLVYGGCKSMRERKVLKRECQ
jgi:hypothetical protein